MKQTFTTMKNKPVFTGWEYFSTPIWNGEFPERVPLLNKYVINILKQPKK